MEAVKAMAVGGPDDAGQAMEAVAGAILECGRSHHDPTRKYKFWRKVCLPAKAAVPQFLLTKGGLRPCHRLEVLAQLQQYYGRDCSCHDLTQKYNFWHRECPAKTAGAP